MQDLKHIINNQWFPEIVAKYSEMGRYYHTLIHLQEMFEYYQRYRYLLQDPATVLLAIFYHDIIYDPKSLSNEEDSAHLFNLRVKEAMEKTSPSPQLACRREKIFNYIIETKAHNVLNHEDYDLKLFIDFDMAILGSDRYLQYSQDIRREYNHVDFHDYCSKRSAFLKSFLENTPNIYASNEFKSEIEIKARENVAKECTSLRDSKILGLNGDIDSV